jgi:hypothetical protein
VLLNRPSTGHRLHRQCSIESMEMRGKYPGRFGTKPKPNCKNKRAVSQCSWLAAREGKSQSFVAPKERRRICSAPPSLSTRSYVLFRQKNSYSNQSARNKSAGAPHNSSAILIYKYRPPGRCLYFLQCMVVNFLRRLLFVFWLSTDEIGYFISTYRSQ